MDELAYRLRQQELTAEFGMFALRTRDLIEILQEATQVCATGLRTDFCKAMEYLPDEDALLVQAGVGWRPGVVGRARTGADEASPSGYAFRSGQPVISNHLESESRFRTPEVLREHGIRRAINVVIRGDGRPFGVLEADSPAEGRFSEIDIAFLQGVANLVGVALERQKAEEAMRRKESLLQQATEHQAMLVREISHRVKNSLGIVAGLLSLQGRMSSDPELQRALADARARVATIGQLHDQLWREEDVHAIQLPDFLGKLCGQMRALDPIHSVTCEIAPVTVTTDRAVPLGLLVNELLTNALKYAYPDGPGEVRLSVAVIEPGRLRLEVCDRGVGLPSGFDAAAGSSLGMKLIATLGRQLGGQIEWRDAAPGARFVLDFDQHENVRA